VGTLRLQGGAMSATEAEAFEAEAFATDALTLRSFDDGGKVAGLDIPALDEWRPLLDSPEFRL